MIIIRIRIIEIPLGVEKEKKKRRVTKPWEVYMFSCHCKHNNRSHYKSTHIASRMKQNVED